MAKVSTAEQLLRERLVQLALAEGGPVEDFLPVRWIQNPTWRCANSHVSKQFNSGRRGRRECVFKFCRLPVQLTFPEDRSGPLLPPARVNNRVDH